MTALTNVAENRSLNWMTGAATTAPVLPLRVALVVDIDDDPDANAGTEVVGGSYGRQTITFAASATNGQNANTNLIRFDNMPDIPAPGVVGFEIWDSATTPVRWWHAPLTTPRTYAAGDAAEFPVGELVLAMD